MKWKAEQMSDQTGKIAIVTGSNTGIGGQVGIAGHLKIGNNVRIAAKSGVMKNIEDGATVGGIPSVPINDWHRQTIILKKLIKKKNNGK